MKKIIMSLLIALAFSCGSADEQHSSLNYGTFTPGKDILKGWSAFTTIERSNCQMPMMLYTANGAVLNQQQIFFIRDSVISAVTAWSSSLQQNPYWPCKQGVLVIWNDPSRVGVVSIYVDAAVSRSYAIVGSNQIFLAPQYANSFDPFASRVILHEMGHMFGLADTYSEPGYQQPVGQLPAIMNNLYQVSWLTQDDLFGANALYEFINGRGGFCDYPYMVGGAWENRNRVAFCIPRS